MVEAGLVCGQITFYKDTKITARAAGGRVGQSFQQMVQGKLNIHIQKNKVRTLTLHQIQN
jgi:ribonuclease D